MFPKGRECLEEACKDSGVDADALMRFLRQPAQEHDGTLSITGDIQAADSGFAPYSGSVAHLNPMPAPRGIHRPIGTDGPDAGDNGEGGVVLLLDNQPGGDAFPMANLHGDGGFAMRISDGVLWNQGETWIAKWAKIRSVTTIIDEKTWNLPAGAEATYFAADCWICGDSRGRYVTREPVRIYSQVEFSESDVGTMVRYTGRDQSGVAWISRSPPPTPPPYAKATDVWDWEVESTGTVGYAMFQNANDLFGATDGASETTYKVYLLATAGQDPNIHINDVVRYETDANGARVAITGYLDSKINTLEQWAGATNNIKAGWIEYTAMRGRFGVGYHPERTDYNALENQGGAHPITVTEHSSGAATWSINDHEFTTSENTTGITVTAHPQTTSSTNATGLTVGDHEFTTSENTTGITVTAHPQTTSSENTTGITVTDHAAKDTSSSATGVNNHSAGTSGGGNANLDDHNVHANAAETTSLDIVESTAPGYTSVTVVVSVSAGGEVLTHTANGHTHSTPELTHSSDEHTHGVSLYEHTVTDGGHAHTSSPLEHTVVDGGHAHTALLAHSLTDSGHAHTSSPLDHVVVDGGHEHTALLEHTGTLPHAAQDLRPPYSTVLWIKRVHPDDE